MSGSGMIGGAAYQAAVIAWLYVHMLREQRLNWFDLADDRPLAVAAEVGGPGDDARIDFAPGLPSVEVQVKHGLSGPARLRDVLARIQQAPSPSNAPIVLAVDRTASTWIHRVLPDDLDCLRHGRSDAIRKDTREFLDSLTPSDSLALHRLHIKVLDVADPEDPESKWAISALQGLLQNPQRADIAWTLLRDDATTLCRRRHSRTTSELRALLHAHDLAVRPPRPLERLDHELDASKALLRHHKPLAALSLLSDIHKQFTSHQPDPPRLTAVPQTFK